MKKILLVLLSGLLLASCASVPLTADQQSYLTKATAIPLTFKVPKEKSQDAWGRAQSFVAQHSTMHIQTATDYVLETYNVTDYNQSGYALTRTPIEDSTQFTVKCDARPTGFMLMKSMNQVGIDNSHILAYYMLTGQTPPDGLVYPN